MQRKLSSNQDAIILFDQNKKGEFNLYFLQIRPLYIFREDRQEYWQPNSERKKVHGLVLGAIICLDSKEGKEETQKGHLHYCFCIVVVIVKGEMKETQRE